MCNIYGEILDIDVLAEAWEMASIQPVGPVLGPSLPAWDLTGGHCRDYYWLSGVVYDQRPLRNQTEDTMHRLESNLMVPFCGWTSKEGENVVSYSGENFPSSDGCEKKEDKKVLVQIFTWKSWWCFFIP